MAKSRLEPRSLIPYFHLLGRGGKDFDLLSLKRKKNLVVFLLSCPCQEFLIRIEDAYQRIQEQNAEIVVISPLSVKEIEQIHSKNRLSFWILSDENKQTFANFIAYQEGETIAGLFIIDRFGEVFFQYLVNDLKEMPPFEDIIKSLAFIESQRPECEGGV